jgi:hypothetical protein
MPDPELPPIAWATDLAKALAHAGRDRRLVLAEFTKEH